MESNSKPSHSRSPISFYSSGSEAPLQPESSEIVPNGGFQSPDLSGFGGPPTSLGVSEGRGGTPGNPQENSLRAALPAPDRSESEAEGAAGWDGAQPVAPLPKGRCTEDMH